METHNQELELHAIIHALNAMARPILNELLETLKICMSLLIQIHDKSMSVQKELILTIQPRIANTETLHVKIEMEVVQLIALNDRILYS